jgi:hypothetical protein
MRNAMEKPKWICGHDPLVWRDRAGDCIRCWEDEVDALSAQSTPPKAPPPHGADVEMERLNARLALADKIVEAWKEAAVTHTGYCATQWIMKWEMHPCNCGVSRVGEAVNAYLAAKEKS